MWWERRCVNTDDDACCRDGFHATCCCSSFNTPFMLLDTNTASFSDLSTSSPLVGAVHPQTPLPFTALYLELALPYTGAGGGVQVWLRPSTHCVADQQQQKRDRVRATRRSRAEWSSVHQLASFSLSLSYTGCRRSCPLYEWKTESRACAPP